ncbi:MAG: ATP-binding protein [candidate division WOR-3 bacterium]|nr:ATP-binding protein [candidate division WOR-3 bacterium]
MDKKNSVVAHPIFGEGVVEASRWEGAELRVKFRSGLELWLPAKWFRPITVKHIKLDQISSKRLLEAFRLGIVPHQDIEYFTFGRGYELSELEQGLKALKEGSGNVYLVEGGYGSGKTHLLEYMHHLCLKYGFVTTYCELSVQETPMYRPKRVYRELVHNLRYIKEGSEYRFRDLLRMVASIEIRDHCFLTPVLRYVKNLEDDTLKNEVFWQLIEGESTKDYATDPLSPFRVRGGHKIPALYDYSTATDYYTYIISGLSHLVYEVGLGGLVIILDEVETIAHIWNYIEYSRGLNFLEGLIQAALDNDGLKVIDKRLLHNRVRPTPYVYPDPHILLILASTPVHGLRDFVGVRELIDRKVVLRRFSKAELELIYNNLYDVYTCAYPAFSIVISQRENIFNAALKRSYGELREFIKFSVEAFDWFRYSKPNP